MKNRFTFLSCCAIGVLSLPVSPVVAQSEATTFTYDALGRVVETSSVRSTETVEYDFSLDDADNRTSMDVTEQPVSALVLPSANDFLAANQTSHGGIGAANALPD